MYLRDDINRMTDDERCADLALILALGVLRLHSHSYIDDGDRRIVPESSQTGLDQCEDSCPDDQHGLVNGVENIRKGGLACR